MNVDRPYSKLPYIKPNVFIAIPMRKEGFLHAETARFCSLLNQHPDVVWGFVFSISPDNSRNSLLEHHFHRDPNWTHILFIDSDTIPPDDALKKLLLLNADVAAGMYPLNMNEGLHWSVSIEGTNWIPMQDDIPDEPFEISSCGAGCLLVRKEVLVDINWPWFKFEFQKLYDNDGKGIKEGEDIYFCRRVKEEGYKIVADPSVKCRHINSVDMLKLWNDAKRQLDR